MPSPGTPKRSPRYELLKLEVQKHRSEFCFYFGIFLNFLFLTTTYVPFHGDRYIHIWWCAWEKQISKFSSYSGPLRIITYSTDVKILKNWLRVVFYSIFKLPGLLVILGENWLWIIQIASSEISFMSKPATVIESFFFITCCCTYIFVCIITC